MGIADHGDVRPEALGTSPNGIPTMEASAGMGCGKWYDYSVAFRRRIARELEGTESRYCHKTTELVRSVFRLKFSHLESVGRGVPFLVAFGLVGAASTRRGPLRYR